MPFEPNLPIDPVNKAVKVTVAGDEKDTVNAAVRVNIVAGGVASTTTAKATAAAPAYVEGTDSPISQDLSGNLRTLATVSATTTAKATTADPSYVNNTDNPISQDLSGHLRTTGLTDTQLRASAVPVSAAALPLPSGASTEATLALIKAKTDNLDVALSTRTKPADTQKVDGSAVTQPVSGTFWQATQPVSGPLTDAQLRATAVPVSGPLTDTQLRASAVPVSAAALPLPTGASTSALQTTGNASLASIDTKLTNPLPVSGAVTAAKATAAAPVYVEASNNPLSLDLAGNLRVVSVGSTTYFPLTESSTYDGSALTYTLGHTPTDEPRVFIGGLRWYLGVHYSRVGAVITWISFPVSGETIQIDYTWSMASSTLNTTLVVDASGNVQPTGDSAARSIHTTLDNPLLYGADEFTAATTAIQTATQSPKGADVGLVVRPVRDTEFNQLLLGILSEIRLEMRITNEILAEGLTVRKFLDPDQMRRDSAFADPTNFS